MGKEILVETFLLSLGQKQNKFYLNPHRMEKKRLVLFSYKHRSDVIYICSTPLDYNLSRNKCILIYSPPISTFCAIQKELIDLGELKNYGYYWNKFNELWRETWKTTK